MILVNDSTRLPDIYNRAADKSKYYLIGVTGKVKPVFQMREHKTHAYHRKLIASSVCHMDSRLSESELMSLQYSFSNVKKMEPLVDKGIEEWIKKLDVKFRQTSEKFDFCQW